MADLIEFPGAGSPAPGPRVVADLDAIGDRYTDLLEARERQDRHSVAYLTYALVDDVPALLDEVARVERLRAELAAELDRVQRRNVGLNQALASYEAADAAGEPDVCDVWLRGVSY